VSKQVNRSLKNKAFDHIDHALGRPVDPMADTYREYFATDRSSALAAEFRSSPHWEEGSGDGKMSYFYVTQAGRRALADHLREIGDPFRTFIVTYCGYPETVAATTPAKARYSRYLSISDVCPDLTFKDFCKNASVRLAA
jgi:hypothetical protein